MTTSTRNEVMCLAVVITHMDDSQTWNWFKTMSTANKFIKKQNLWAFKRLIVFVDTQNEEELAQRSDERDELQSELADAWEEYQLHGSDNN